MSVTRTSSPVAGSFTKPAAIRSVQTRPWPSPAALQVSSATLLLLWPLPLVPSRRVGRPPERSTASGAMSELVSSFRIADCCPRARGSKRTVSRQLDPGATGFRQPSPIGKSPGSAPSSNAPEMTSGDEPRLVTVSVCAVLASPVGSLPKRIDPVLPSTGGAEYVIDTPEGTTLGIGPSRAVRVGARKVEPLPPPPGVRHQAPPPPPKYPPPPPPPPLPAPIVGLVTLHSVPPPPAPPAPLAPLNPWSESL